MAVPDYQTFMLPVLGYIGGKPAEEIPTKVLLDAMAKEFSLKEEDLREMLPSGVSTTLGSRVGWARTYLKKPGLLDAPRRGHIRITARGLEGWLVLVALMAWMGVTGLKHFLRFRGTKLERQRKDSE